MRGRFWLSFVLSWAIAIVASSVRADSAAVTVLGVRSLDGDDQLERKISHALRNSARGIEGYRVSDREVSLAQMSLAHGCEDVDLPCLKDIAATLSADRLIYGNLVRSGDKVRISLFNFAASSGQVDGSAERTVAAAQLSEPTLSEIVLDLIQRTAGKRGSSSGTLRITGNRPGAEVSLDGKLMGSLDERGELVLEGVREGAHTVLVATSDGRDRRELSVDVRPDTTTNLRALLTPPLPSEVEPATEEAKPEAQPVDPVQRKQRIYKGLGYASVGVALGFAAATIYSWVRIGNIQDDPKLETYAMQFPKEGPGSTNDVCSKAVKQELTKVYANTMYAEEKAAIEAPATDLCNEADKLEKLQYVFIGGTVAFAGVGTWLLWEGYRDRSRSVSLQPNVSLRSAGLRATLRF
jgi:hypothetical protein